VLSAGSIGTTAASDSLPAPGHFPTHAGYRPRHSDRTIPQAARPGRASPVPAITIRTFRALYAEEFFGAAVQALHPFHGLHPTGRGSALPDTRSRRGRLRLMLRTARSHTPKGCLTLRFDPARFPAKPAACYRASWQLPGPDLPRQATTSLSLKSRSIYSSPSNSLGALPLLVEL
jgi:hypothetical protein